MVSSDEPLAIAATLRTTRGVSVHPAAVECDLAVVIGDATAAPVEVAGAGAAVSDHNAVAERQ